MNTNMKFTITGQRIELTEPVMLVAGTMNIYTASFAFDAAWDGYTKTVVFRGGDVEREQLLTDDSCEVPWEVLLPGAYLKVGVYGTRDGSRLPTIWTERTQYINSGAGPTDEAEEPSPTLVEQLLTKVGNLDTLKTEDKSSLVAAINEIWASGGGGSGASVTDATINEDGHLIITLSTGKAIDAGYAVGPAGADGKDGAPGQAGPPGPAGADGVGIQSIAQTTTSTEDGGTNVITVTKSDGTSSTFAVRNGSRGSTGPAGADGKDGQDGAPGKDGADGAAGPAGADGKSAYQYAQDGGYIGTEQEFAAKLAQEMPAALPNPNALTFTGAVTGSYDGSKPLTVDIPSGGGSGGSNIIFDSGEISEEVNMIGPIDISAYSKIRIFGKAYPSANSAGKKAAQLYFGNDKHRLLCNAGANKLFDTGGNPVSFLIYLDVGANAISAFSFSGFNASGTFDDSNYPVSSQATTSDGGCLVYSTSFDLANMYITAQDDLLTRPWGVGTRIMVIGDA